MGKIARTSMRLLLMEQRLFGAFAQILLLSEGFRLPHAIPEIRNDLLIGLDDSMSVEDWAHEFIAGCIRGRDYEIAENSFSALRGKEEMIYVVVCHANYGCDPASEDLNAEYWQGENSQPPQKLTIFGQPLEIEVPEADKERQLCYHKGDHIYLIDPAIPDEEIEELKRSVTEKELGDRVKALKPNDYVLDIVRNQAKAKVFLRHWGKLRDQAIQQIVQIPYLREFLLYAKNQQKISRIEVGLHDASNYLFDAKYEECAQKTRKSTELLLHVMLDMDVEPKLTLGQLIRDRGEDIANMYGWSIVQDLQDINKTANRLIHTEGENEPAKEEFPNTDVFLMLERANLLLNLFKWRAGYPAGIQEP